MSGVNKVLFVTPERKMHKEKFVIKGFTCPVCKGQKQFHNEVARNKIESTDCTFCGGTGNLQCEIQLNWMPDEIST